MIILRWSVCVKLLRSSVIDLIFMANSRSAPTILKLRNDPRLRKAPTYISLVCILGGLIWVLLLPLNQYSRQTYISENALLPGQVHTYFAGSEQNIFRAYKYELAAITGRQLNESSSKPSQTNVETSNKIRELFRNAGLKNTGQHYKYQTSGQEYSGENVYAVLHAPRGDGTEAIALVAALKNAEGQDNTNGVALLLTLAQYFKRTSQLSTCAKPHY